jgi:hypothetical protein
MAAAAGRHAARGACARSMSAGGARLLAPQGHKREEKEKGDPTG